MKDKVILPLAWLGGGGSLSHWVHQVPRKLYKPRYANKFVGVSRLVKFPGKEVRQISVAYLGLNLDMPLISV